MGLGLDLGRVKLFATVPDSQHHYDTGCLDEESWGKDRVTDYGS